LFKNSIFFWRDSYNIVNFAVKFYSKICIDISIETKDEVEMMAWVYFKRETKSEDEILFKD